MLQLECVRCSVAVRLTLDLSTIPPAKCKICSREKSTSFESLKIHCYQCIKFPRKILKLVILTILIVSVLKTSRSSVQVHLWFELRSIYRIFSLCNSLGIYLLSWNLLEFRFGNYLRLELKKRKKIGDTHAETQVT